MNSKEVFDSFNVLVSHIAWPATTLIILFILRAQIKEFLISIHRKIDKSQKVSFSKDGLQMEERAIITEARVELLQERVSGAASPDSSQPDAMGYLWNLAMEYDGMNIKDYTARVRKKQELGREMGLHIIKHSLQLGMLTKEPTEGIQVGIAYTVLIQPKQGDQRHLFDIYMKSHQLFTKYTIVSALEELISRKIIDNVQDKRQVEDVLNRFKLRADEPLKRRISRVRRSLNSL